MVAHEAVERTYQALSRSFGASGSHALLARALAQAQSKHPLVKELLLDRRSGPALDNMASIVQTHGAPAVATALEAVLETLLDLLGRLIGDDMVARLIEQSSSTGTQDDEDAR